LNIFTERQPHFSKRGYRQSSLDNLQSRPKKIRYDGCVYHGWQQADDFKWARSFAWAGFVTYLALGTEYFIFNFVTPNNLYGHIHSLFFELDNPADDDNVRINFRINSMDVLHSDNLNWLGRPVMSNIIVPFNYFFKEGSDIKLSVIPVNPFGGTKLRAGIIGDYYSNMESD